jgi:peptidoglycan/LPS O-acetylase OafA/YrhL
VKTNWIMRALRIAAVCALLALALMMWGVLDPRPIALVIAMSVGQVLGTLSFGLYVLAVFVDLRSAGVFSDILRRTSFKPHAASSSKPPDDSTSKRP